MNAGVFVGLDIGRSSLQAAARPAGQKWVANTDDTGICEIANVLTSVQPEIIVIEAQGGIGRRARTSEAWNENMRLCLLAPKAPLLHERCRHRRS